MHGIDEKEKEEEEEVRELHVVRLEISLIMIDPAPGRRCNLFTSSPCGGCQAFVIIILTRNMIVLPISM